MQSLKNLLVFSIILLFIGIISYAKEPHAKKTTSTDTESVRVSVRKALPEIRKCYETYLKKLKDKARGGKIVMKWVIGTDGIAHSFEQESDEIKNATLNNCIAFSLSSTKFPKSPKDQEAIITYPFIFNPDK